MSDEPAGFVDFDPTDPERAAQFVKWLRTHYRIAAIDFQPSARSNLRVRAPGVSLHLLQALCATFSMERCQERLLNDLLRWYGDPNEEHNAPCWARAKRAHRALKNRLGSE
jgi:hypothetical protein